MSEASVREFVLTATATEITNRIEQQAKELAEAQARVVVLETRLKEIRNDHWTHWPDRDNQKVNEALASTDTAAQTLREKHYEECAEICHSEMTGYTPHWSPDRLNGYNAACEDCAAAIRAAAKESHERY